MAQVRKAQRTKTAKPRQHTSAKRDAPMSLGERGRMIAAAEEFRATRSDFDLEYEDEYWAETEAEVARLLGKAW